MDSTAASAGQNSSHSARPGAPETSNNSKQTNKSSSEPHQRNSQDISNVVGKNSSGNLLIY